MIGIANVFPEDQYFAYYDPTHPFSILQAIDYLATLSAEGPFDSLGSDVVGKDITSRAFSLRGIPVCRITVLRSESAARSV